MHEHKQAVGKAAKARARSLVYRTAGERAREERRGGFCTSAALQGYSGFLAFAVGETAVLAIAGRMRRAETLRYAGPSLNLALTKPENGVAFSPARKTPINLRRPTGSR